MAIAIGIRFGDRWMITGFQTTPKPKLVKVPGIWQRMKQAAYELAMGLMPSPLAVA